jgi:predicted ATPase
MVAPAGSFVGREHELRTLYAALDEAIAGHGGIVMLAGEPGIGKTRTAQELADHAGRHGASVLWGRCYEEAGAPPYWPWVQIFRGALSVTDPRALLAEVGAAASDMADILPEIRDLAPTLEPSQRLEDPAQARFRMFESIHRFIASLSRSRTVLLVLDDLHWADAPSLRLLEFLAPEIADSRLLLVGTYRANELSRQHPLSDALGGMARVPHVTRVLLTGLNAGEVHDFIADDRDRPAGTAYLIPPRPDRGKSALLAGDRAISPSARVVRSIVHGIAADDPDPRRSEGGDRAPPQLAVGSLQRRARPRLGDRPGVCA